MGEGKGKGLGLGCVVRAFEIGLTSTTRAIASWTLPQRYCRQHSVLSGSPLHKLNAGDRYVIFGQSHVPSDRYI